MVIHDAQFFVGSRYSGAPAHYHSHAMNFLVRGKKRWLLWPPSSALYSRVPAVSWLDRKDARAYQCVQPENASCVRPRGRGHAVLNLEDHTVGVALEFHVAGELAWSFESRATHPVSHDRRQGHSSKGWEVRPLDVGADEDVELGCRARPSRRASRASGAGAGAAAGGGVWGAEGSRGPPR